MITKLFRFCAVACFLFSFTSLAQAQAITGSLLGAITDSSGAVASGASVTITETRTNISNN